MVSTFQWVKLIVENAKVVIPLILMLCTALGWTITDGIAKDEEIRDTQEQVGRVASHLSRQHTATSTVIQQSNGVAAHEKEYHK